MEKDEIDKIVDTVLEMVFLRIPEIIGNMMQNHAELQKINKDFYTQYPEYKNDPATVRSVIHEIEKENVDIDYKELLSLAAPKIKERIKTISKLNTTDVVSKEDVKLDFNMSMDSNGEI